MSANVETMFYTRTTPWHGLGTKVLEVPTSKDAQDETYVEPDVLIVCAPSKLEERGVKGAPDFIAEIVSPSSRKMDYVVKADLYLEAGVREYWIIDPVKECTMIYHFEEDAAPTIIPFSTPVTVRIYGDLVINIDSLL